MWGTVLKRDLLGEIREEDKFHTKEQLQEYLISEIKRQGKNVVIRNLDASLVEDFSHLFESIAYGVETLDLSGWKTSNVKSIYKMFWYCPRLESIDVSGWDTSNVEDMSDAFFQCASLKSLDLSSWDTSNAEYMNWMFGGCESLKSLDLSGWDTSNAMLDCMFYKCPAPYEVVDGNKIVKK